jgi:hypothetical protein
MQGQGYNTCRLKTKKTGERKKIQANAKRLAA